MRTTVNNNTARKFNAVKFVGLTENGDNRARIAGGDRRVSTAPDFVLEARLYQINHRAGFALAVEMRSIVERRKRDRAFGNKKITARDAGTHKDGTKGIQWLK